MNDPFEGFKENSMKTLLTGMLVLASLILSLFLILYALTSVLGVAPREGILIMLLTLLFLLASFVVGMIIEDVRKDRKNP